MSSFGLSFYKDNDEIKGTYTAADEVTKLSGVSGVVAIFQLRIVIHIKFYILAFKWSSLHFVQYARTLILKSLNFEMKD